MPKFGAYMRGEGTKGEQGDAAGFNNISATAYTVEGETPIVSVSTSGSNTALDVAFNFGLVRGEAAGFSTEQNATIEVISVTSSPIISVTTDDSSPDNSKVFDFYFGIPHPNDIVNIVQTSTAVEDEGNNEITVYYRNNETTTFYVKNGSKGTPAIIEGSVSSTSQLPTTNLHNGMSYIVGTNTKRLYVYLNGNWTDQGPITAAGFGVPEGTLEILPYEDEFTVNGKIANFESDREALVNNLTVDIEPVQDLHGYDAPWPAGGGKNKFDQSIFGESTSAVFVDYQLESGQTYTFSTNIPSKLITIQTTNTSLQDVAQPWNNNPVTFSVTGTGVITIRYYNGSDTKLKNYWFQCELGSTATAYAPYENICPISGHTGAKVMRTGKNLLDAQNLLDAGVTVSGGVYSGTMSQFGSAGLTNGIKFKANTQYRMTVDSASRISQGYMQVQWTYTDGTNNSVSFVGTSATYTASSTAGKTVESAKFKGYSSSSSATVTAKDFMLCESVESTDYEAFQKQTVTIQFGQTVYGGSVDVKTGTLTVDSVLYQVPRLTAISVNSGYIKSDACDGYIVLNDPAPYPLTGAPNHPATGFYCNQLAFINKGIWSSVGYANCFTINNNQLHLNISNDLLGITDYTQETTTTVKDKLLTYLNGLYDAGEYIYVVYKVAPQTYQLTPQQLTTLLGVNNIWSDTGDVSVTYTSKSKPEISVTTDPTSPESAKIFYFDFKIPETPGPPGEKGDTPVLELSASTTILPSTSTATVSVTSLSENEFNFNFGIPEAPAPLMSASVSTSTLEPNENANVSVTVNENVFHFDFDIPKGGEGKRGIGVSGIQYKETTTTGDIIYSMNFADPEGTTTFSNDFKVPAGPEGIGFYQKITFTSTDGDDYSWINSGENTSTLVIDRSSNKILPLSIYNLNNNNIAATFTVTSSKSGYPYGTIEYETEEKFDGVLYYIGEAPTPQLAIGSVTTYEGAIASVTTERLGNNYLLNFVFPTKGDTGNGISSIEQVSVEGLTTNYRINYTDNSTPFDFAIRNGEQGIQGQQGIQGIQGNPAGFGEPTISVSSISPDDNPTVSISTSGPDTAKIFDFSFGIPSGRAATIEVDPQITIIESTSSPTVNNIGTSTQAQLHFNLLPSMNYICSTTDLNEGDTLPAGTFYFYYEG